MHNGSTQLARTDRIEGSIDRATAGSIGVSAQRGMAIESMSQAMELAKLMAVSDKAVPSHLRQNPGACLAVAIQGYEWGINPFAIANKTYVVNDRLAYESALYQSVLLRRAPIRGRLKITYAGSGTTRTCTVAAELADGTGTVDYTTPQFGSIPTKNSPLWRADPDQQLYYFAVRSFARRHFADVMMGVYTVDELQDAGAIPTTVRVESRAQQVLAEITPKVVTDRPVSEGQTFVPDAEAADRLAAQDAHLAESVIEAENEPVPAPEAPAETAPAPAVERRVPASWDDAVSMCEAIAASRGDDEKEMHKRLNAWKLRTRRPTPPMWAVLVEAYDNGKLNADGTIAA